jgi:SAM-dependent methyltransferase
MTLPPGSRNVPTMTDLIETPSDDPYRSIVAFYDLEHDDYDEDIEFLLGVIGDNQMSVLEMGSGSGRVLQALVEQEIPVTGIDRSGPMHEAAVRRLSSLETGGLATLVDLDMTQVDRLDEAGFGIAAYTLNALMHLASPADQVRSLTAARTRLKPHGLVMIDVMNPHPEQLVHLGSGVILEGSWTLPDGRTVDKWSHRSLHPADQIVATDIWYDVLSLDGEARRFRTSFNHRYLHSNELLLMLQLAGYGNVVLYGGYGFEPYEDDSERLIALATNGGA